MSETAVWSLISIAIGIILACIFHFCITDKAKKTLAYFLLFIAGVIVIVVLFNTNSCGVTSGGTSTGSNTETPTQAGISEPTPDKDEGSSTGAGTSTRIVTTRPYQGRIAAGYNFTVALKDDGTVVCVGGDADINVDSWQGMKQIAAYGNHILGLYENGAVAFTGKSVYGEREVSGWRDVAQVAACYKGSIGLTTDGHVLYTG